MLNTISLENSNVTYWEGGNANGPPLLLIHGLGGDYRGLLGCTAPLTEYRVIIPDLPGYGMSEALKVPHTLVAYANFIESFRDALKLGRTFVIGHSFGAAIALTYARRFPTSLQKLILLNPVTGMPHTLSGRLGGLYMTTACMFPEPVAHWLVCNKLAVYVTDRAVMTPGGKQYRKQILEEDYANYKRASIRAMREGIVSLNAIRTLKLGDNTSKNTTIIAGTKDVMATIEESRKLADTLKATFISLPGGHLLPLEDPLLTSQTLAQVLQ